MKSTKKNGTNHKLNIKKERKKETHDGVRKQTSILSNKSFGKYMIGLNLNCGQH
jgi:hypothetical protein